MKLNATAGSYTITVPDHGTTAAINWDAKIADIKCALEAVLGVGNIAVHALTATGYGINGDSRQFEHLGFILEFTGTLAESVSARRLPAD